MDFVILTTKVNTINSFSNKINKKNIFNKILIKLLDKTIIKKTIIYLTI